MSPRRTAEEAERTRSEILDATLRVVQKGVGGLTIRAVAVEAGVSTGAVLHHFATKEALVKAMVERRLDVFDAEVERRSAMEAGERGAAAPGRWLRAYAQTTIDSLDNPTVNDTLLASVTTGPEVGDSILGRSEQWQRRAETDGLSPTRASLVRMAVDGLAYARFLGFTAPKGEKLEELRDAIFELTEAGRASVEDPVEAEADAETDAETEEARR